MTAPAPNTPETTEHHAESGALTRLRLGTNTLKALIINDRPVVALSDGGLYVEPRYARALTYVVARDTAYVVGTIDVNSVSIVITPDGISIAGVGRIAGETLNELRVTISEKARVHIEAD